MTPSVRTPPAGITVVIPCHNGERFLAAAIRSAQSQTRPPDSILVVDDASTDTSAAIAEAAGATVIRLDVQRGNGAARNAGLRAARTALVALLDADDLWLPHHCARVACLLEAHPEAGAAFSTLQVIREGVPVTDEPLYTPGFAEGPPQMLFETCLRRYVGAPSACILRTETALAVGGFDELMPLGVDFDMWLRLSLRAPLVATHDLTALYRRHAAQISNRRELQIEMCYRARRNAWQGLVDGDDAIAADRTAAIIREVWNGALQAEWDLGRMDSLAELLALAPLVPGSDDLLERWARRAAIPRPLLWAWTRSAERLRVPIRRVVQWLEGRRS